MKRKREKEKESGKGVNHRDASKGENDTRPSPRDNLYRLDYKIRRKIVIETHEIIDVIDLGGTSIRVRPQLRDINASAG